MNIKLKSILIAILIISTFSCNREKEKYLPFKPENLVDVEPNDVMREPNLVTSQSPILGFFEKKGNVGDKDYYKVYFSLRDTSYEMIQTAVPGIDTKITFFSPTGKRLFFIDDGGKGESEKLWDYSPSGDHIILLIESKIGYNEKVPYIIDFLPKIDQGIDEIEPNNTMKNAVLIKPDETKKGLISPRGDIDYYKIDIQDEKIYDFGINIETLSNIDINITIINTLVKNNKYINHSSWGGKEFYPFLSNEKGEYFIKVSGNIKTHDRKDPIYYISIDKNHEKETNDDFYFEREYNDKSNFSTELIDGVNITGIFYPKNDEDWYKFDLFKDSISVDLSLSSIRGVDPIIELYDKDLKKIRTINENKKDHGEEVSLNSLQKGRYFIKLTSRDYSLLLYKLFFNIRYK